MKRISLVFVCEMSDRTILYLIKEWVLDEKRIVKGMDIDVRLGQCYGQCIFMFNLSRNHYNTQYSYIRLNNR